jgi:hypothetical protein
MQVTRKIAAAAAVATVATLGLATVVSANMIDDGTAKANSSLADAASVASKVTKATDGLPQWYWVKSDGSLVAVIGNLVGPFQGCQNFVPVNGVGGQVPVTDITGVVGLLNDGSSVTAVKTCVQDSTQADKWYRMGNDGLLSVSRKNVGPFNVCHNEVPVDGLGDQVPLSDLTSLLDLGLGNVDNSTDVLKTCEQLTQNN